MSSGLQDAGIQLAETIQTAHVNEAPNRARDLNPSTAASKKEPVELDEDVSDIGSDIDEGEIPLSVLRPVPRKPQLPPLPDLRFEQSYLASIENAKGWQGVAYITMRDQVMMPLIQGVAWTLIVAGWRHWNRATQFRGQSVGARIRRWWWEVNNWKLPERGFSQSLRDKKFAGAVAEVS